MKKAKSLIILFFATLLLGVFFQCENPCDCDPVLLPYTKIEAIGIKHKDLFKGELEVEEKVEVANYTFSIPMLMTFTADTYKPQQNWFMNSAIACECAFNGHLGIKNQIDSITFKVLTDYDQKYKAGSNVNDLIKVSDNFNPSFSNNLQTFISSFNTFSFDDNSFRFGFSLNNSTEFLDKVKNSNDGMPFQLSIELKFKDGTKMSGNSKLIKLTK
jgi:hypothetical protein